MLVFCAFTSHSPLLLESIGKDAVKKLAPTVAAMKQLSVDLAEAKPDTIVLLTSHPGIQENVFSINLASEYHIDLSDFGEWHFDKHFKPDMQSIDRIKRQARQKQINIKLDSHPGLDHGAAIPLLFLTEHLPDVSIVPIAYSEQSPKVHIEFGRIIKDLVVNSDKRIALIASGDLSHCLSTQAPSGFRKEGEIFDTNVQEAIKSISSSKLLSFDQEVVRLADECAYKSLLILFGVIERMNIRPEILAYQSPFGVGHLTVRFHLNAC